MEQPPVVVRQIAWAEVFPWWILLKTLRIALAPILVVAATLAVWLTPHGWNLAALLLLSREEHQAWQERFAPLPPAHRAQLARAIPLAPRAYLPSASSAFLDAYTGLTEPFWRFFSRDLTARQALVLLVGGLWTLLVWSFPGGIITRWAGVQLATGQAPGLRAVWRLAMRRYGHYVGAPLYPLLGAGLLALPVLLLGLGARWLGTVGLVLLALGWPLALLLGLGATWLLAGVLLGWPLLWPAISLERDGDVFDAFSRSFSYVYKRPLHYFLYAVLAAALGALLWAVADAAARLLVYWCWWGLAWGAGGPLVQELHRATAWWEGAAGSGLAAPSTIGLRVAGWALAMGEGLVRNVAVGLRYSFFFTAATAIYLLLRHDVDEKELDEVDEPG